MKKIKIKKGWGRMIISFLLGVGTTILVIQITTGGQLFQGYLEKTFDSDVETFEKQTSDPDVETFGKQTAAVALCGDADNDGDTDLADLTSLIGYIFINPVLPNPFPGDPPLYNMDVNGDGNLSPSDVQYYVRFLFVNPNPPLCSPDGQLDFDNDNVSNNIDNCPIISNSDQNPYACGLCDKASFGLSGLIENCWDSPDINGDARVNLEDYEKLAITWTLVSPKTGGGVRIGGYYIEMPPEGSEVLVEQSPEGYIIKVVNLRAGQEINIIDIIDGTPQGTLKIGETIELVYIGKEVSRIDPIDMTFGLEDWHFDSFNFVAPKDSSDSPPPRDADDFCGDGKCSESETEKTCPADCP